MNAHNIELRIRYAETDQMGVVYYSNYLVWFEIARTEFFRSKGLDYCRIEQERKIYLPVTEAYCRYRSPLKYDDVITVTVELTDAGRSRISFGYRVKKGDRTAATGYTGHVFVDEKGKPVAVPGFVREAFFRG
ncbi:MAG: acyl-CoA thioesterase [Candidatus Omnitrophica bacterium]|nr:acyl-CoA thioesterase [Candidatus Omnitrophota bacterium]